MEQHSPLETGLFLEQFPYVAAGSGPGAIAVFPHIREAFEDLRSARWCQRWLRRFSKTGMRVCIIGRRTVLPEGYTTRDMADDYARVLRECIGPAGVMGFSLGGLIAQHVAAEHPDLVSALILAVSGYRIAPGQHAMLLHWIDLARRGRWTQIFHDLTCLMHCGVGAEMDDLAAFFLGPSLQRLPGDPRRFIVSVQASLAHNAGRAISRILCPTLIIGGAQDSLFPPAIVHATRQRIPHARLAILERAGHGAFDEHKRAFDRQVLDFLHDG